MLGFQAVVVSDHAACFWPKFVGCAGEVCKKGQLGPCGHDVEDVGVMVESVDSVRRALKDVGED